MANWKKMAEAFGRATKRPGGSAIRAKELGLGKSAERTGADYEYEYGKDLGNEIEEKAYRADPDYGEKYQKTFDKLSDEETDEALIANRQKEWDDTFKAAKEHVRRGYGDSYPEDMTEEGADAFEKQLWDVIDELKAQGRSVEDILGALKSMGAK